MGEHQVQLIEQNVTHNTEDIRELKKRIDHAESEIADLKSNHKLTNQNITHILETLSDLKTGFGKLDEKLDTNNIEQLKAYKKAVWQVGITVVGGVVVALVIFGLNLK